MDTQDSVTQVVEEAVRRHANRWGGHVTKIQSDQRLMEFVDSFGFFTLILEIERQLNLQLDLSNVDMSRLAHFGGLVEFFIRQHSGSSHVAGTSSL